MMESIGGNLINVYKDNENAFEGKNSSCRFGRRRDGLWRCRRSSGRNQRFFSFLYLEACKLVAEEEEEEEEEEKEKEEDHLTLEFVAEEEKDHLTFRRVSLWRRRWPTTSTPTLSSSRS